MKVLLALTTNAGSFDSDTHGFPDQSFTTARNTKQSKMGMSLRPVCFWLFFCFVFLSVGKQSNGAWPFRKKQVIQLCLGRMKLVLLPPSLCENLLSVLPLLNSRLRHSVVRQREHKTLFIEVHKTYLISKANSKNSWVYSFILMQLSDNIQNYISVM